MKRLLKYDFLVRTILLLILIYGFSRDAAGQGATCATATLLPTNTTATCATYTTTATTGGSVCVGGGFGGGGFLSWFRFCTDANANCIELNLTPGTLTGAYNYALYATCGGGLVAGQLGANNCFGAGGPSTWTSTGLNLAANTCYYMAIWTKNSGTFQICSKKIAPPPNDECNGATQVTAAPTAANNFCYTPNTADPPPGTFCAVSNENSSWFVFTAQCNGSVTLNITNITCVGGAGGFQIGFYTGTCNNLTGIGCNSGTGGAVTTTVTNLTAGQTIYILVDGNAGSQCTFNVSATNTTPDISPPVTICSGQSTTLTAYGGTTYQWSNGATTPSITVSPTVTTTYTVVVNNCTATTLSTTVTVNQPVPPQFAQVGPVCPGVAFTLPTTSSNGITGTWSPAINTAATTTYTFTPDAGQCATTATMTVQVSNGTTPLFTQVGPVCRGQSFTLPATSNNGISGTWTPAINTTATTTYTFTPAPNSCALTTTMTVTVNPPVTPTFTQLPSFCSGGSFTLPATSNNSITGTWSPAINNTATTTYTFTPSAGQCATTATMTVTIQQPVTPVFTQVAPVCTGSTFSLPGTSNNNISGSWSPAIDNTATTTYTFTPTVGQCATTATMTVTIQQPVTPTFTQLGPICSGGSLTLPNTSGNGIPGTWSPAVNNTATTTYTFTPANGQCATTASMTVQVTGPITPTFTQVGPLCQGQTFNLPASSSNGISGTWSPAINTNATTTYTFTPAANVCATTATMTVTITTAIVPDFTQIPPVCAGTSFTIPGTSNNGVTGIWSPQPNPNFTTAYTFTPTAGLCATSASMTVVIQQPVSPTFTQVQPICAGGSFTLPNVSTNGISGNWFPAINNTTTTNYVFTPDANTCATNTLMTVTVNQPVAPIFTQVPAICSGGTFSLPATSNNGISGTWSPAINNTNTTTYTFTPNAGQCATVTTMTVNVNTPTTVPDFTQVAPICSGGTFTLPGTSINGISGTWSPAINNSTTTTYTFTPAPNACALTTTMTVTVNAPVTSSFTQVNPICSGGSFTLPTTSNNGISGSWSPAINNTATTTYTFTPSAGQCATTASMTVTVNQPVTPTFPAYGPYCQNAIIPAVMLPNTSNNGINGTWNPGMLSTAVAGNITYTFTPSSGECAVATTITTVVNAPAIPQFTQVGPLCRGAVFTLPAVSLNNVSGNWSPAIDNTTTTTYTFIPSGNQCAAEVQMTVVINDPVVPSFTQVPAICQGGTFTLPSVSNDGYAGNWSPAINISATTTYTFTPSSTGCVTSAQMTVAVNPPSTVPDFTQLSPVCQGQSFTLPTTSNNAISGTWSPAPNSNVATTYTFTPAPNSCATTASMTVQVTAPVASSFTQVPPICSGETFSLPGTSNNGINGVWSPAIDNTSTTNYTFTPNAGQCALPASMTVIVNQPSIPLLPLFGPYCQNQPVVQPMLPGTSLNGITGTWNPAMISTASAGSDVYTFTPSAGECAIPGTITIVVNAPAVPQFTQEGPFCNGANFTLPFNSLNAVTGVWTPLINNTATTTYTFIPTIGLCATTTQMTVVINQPAVPDFTQVPAICQGSTFTLPSVSNDGYSGSWSPAINTSATTTYTFTPSSAGCVTSAQMTVAVNPPSTVPDFTQLPPVCRGEAFTLPTTSNNSISGTWSPAPNSNATTTYTFTPAANSCAVSTSMTVVVNAPTTSTFAQLPDVCSGSSFTLPTTSGNGFTGSWSPAPNSSVATTYTFTPDPGQCATSATMAVGIIQPVTPAFSPFGPYCLGEVIAQPMLPGTSSNGVSGIWNPAMISTASAGSDVYTFTPSAGLCAVPININIVVNTPAVPQFTQVGPLCSGTNFSLPLNSNNGITGVWNPAITNTATTTYTFTPTIGICAVTGQMTVVINQPAVPDFTQVPAICQGGTLALPSVSNDGYSGNWSPAINNNATTTYTFTPVSSACVTSAQMTVVVNQPSTVPLFTQAGPVCSGTAFSLPSVSNNGINGVWTPAINNTATTQYTFSPDPNSCALPTSMTVTVNNPVASVFTQLPDICSGNSFTLPGVSNNGITGSWTPAINNTATTAYSFTPDAGQCASPASMTVNVNQRAVPSFSPYGPYCQNEVIGQPILPTSSNNGIQGAWNPGAISTANPGSFVYSFTPAAGECATTADINVVVNAPVVPQFNPVGPLCSGTAFTLPAGSLNSVSGTWSPAVDNTATTTYTFTPAAGACAVTAQMSVLISQPVDPVFTQIPAICTGGSFSLPGISGNGISGSWSPAINNSQTTTYSFTPDPGQCANNNSMTVQVNSPVTPQFAPIGSVCTGTSFTLPSVSLDGITGSWTPPVNNSATTTYNFTPDPNQCANNSATMTVTVSNNIVPSFAPVNPICAGAPLNALPVTSLNGINGTWSPSINNNSTTAYTFTPTAGQCSNTPVSLTIVVNSIPQPPVLSATQPTCTTLGSLSITGNTGFAYSVNGGAFSPNLNYGSLQGNTYQVIAQSPEGCLSSASSVNIAAPPPVPSAPVVNVTQAGCTTSAVISITGVPGEQYSYDNGPFNNTLVINSPAAGQHTVTAQNSSGCVSASVTVTVDPSPSIPLLPNLTVQQPTCTTPGSFVINAVAGENYSVDGGPFATVYNFNPAAPGNHTVIAQNAAGCVSPPAVINILPSPPVPSTPVITVSQPTCTTAGTLVITGAPGETYSFDGGPFNATLNYNSVSTGNHTVVAQNSAGCVSQPAAFSITNPPGIPQTPVLNVSQPDCNNPSGSFVISGVVGESYSINGGPFVTNLSYTGLAAGNYNVVAQNASGCISSTATTVIQQAPSVPAVPVVSAVQPTCTVASSITITGTPGETYSVNGGAFSNTLVYNSVAAGNYSIVAQNSSGCISAPAALTINQAPGTPQPPVVNAVQPGCTSPGSLAIIGVPGESYSLNGGAFSSSLNYNSLSSGNYSIVAQNSTGCISSATVVNIALPPAIPPAPTVNAIQPTCTVSTGSFTITAIAGETYSVNGGSFSGTTAFNAQAPGNYQVTAQNAAGCISPATAVVISNPPPVPAAPQLTAVNPGCRETTGQINIAGQPGETYSVDGGPFSANLNIGSILPGNHTVTAQNSFGCVSTAGNITINNPPSVPATPQATAIQPGCTTPGSIQVTGVAGLLYSLDGGPFSTTLNYSPLSSGTYNIVAQNNAGCVSDPLTLTITLPPGIPGIPTASVVQPTCTVSTGSFAINAVAGETYAVNGSSFSGTVNYPALASGNYAVVATNSSGCISPALNVVINPAPVVPPAPSVLSPLNYCQNTLVSPLTATGTGQLLWYAESSGGLGSPNAPVPSTASTGTTNYYVSQVSGPCEGPRSMITVRVSESPQLGNPANVQICQNATLNLNSIYGPGARWFFNQAPVANPSAVSQPGVYSIISTNSFGCSDTNTVTLSIRPPLIANAGPDDSVQILAPYQMNGSGNGVSYTWTPSQPLNNANTEDPVARIKEDTRFVLMVEDDLGCRAFDTMWLRVIYAENVYVPSAFSPNGDGLNDIFSPAPLGGIKELEYFRVYNRLGELVFETRDITEGWDGTYRGRKQDVANYVWVLKGKNKYGVLKFLKGNVVLIR